MLFDVLYKCTLKTVGKTVCTVNPYNFLLLILFVQATSPNVFISKPLIFRYTQTSFA